MHLSSNSGRSHPAIAFLSLLNGCMDVIWKNVEESEEVGKGEMKPCAGIVELPRVLSNGVKSRSDSKGPSIHSDSSFSPSLFSSRYMIGCSSESFLASSMVTPSSIMVTRPLTLAIDVKFEGSRDLSILSDEKLRELDFCSKTISSTKSSVNDGEQFRSSL